MHTIQKALLHTLVLLGLSCTTGTTATNQVDGVKENFQQLRVAKVEVTGVAPLDNRVAVLMLLSSKEHYRVKTSDTFKSPWGVTYQVVSIPSTNSVILSPEGSDDTMPLTLITDEEKAAYKASFFPGP